MTLTAGSGSASTSRLNLAVGLFDHVGRTAFAVEELQRNCFDLGRSRLVVPKESEVFTSDALAQLGQSVTIDRIKLVGFNADRAWSEIIVARVRTTGGTATRLEDLAGHSTGAILARHNQRLIQHLESGGGVLVVGLHDQAQQQTVAGMLLRLASGVFTHQVRAPKMAMDSGSAARRTDSVARNRNSARLN